jgi:hypothetical protein
MFSSLSVHEECACITPMSDPSSETLVNERSRILHLVYFSVALTVLTLLTQYHIFRESFI